jgi:hypothetical protein
LAANFENEEKSLHNIQEILTRFEGKEDAKSPLIEIDHSTNTLKESFTQPIKVLDTIYELLNCLKAAGWDVSIPEKARDTLKNDIEKTIQNIHKIIEVKEYPNPYQQIEEYVVEYRRFLYFLLNIQNLYGSVKSLCQNYEIATKKLLGESSENLQ